LEAAVAPRSVLVLHCDDRSGLTAIRSLGRAGIVVDVGWPTDRCAIESRYVRNVFDLPNPNHGLEVWLDMLKGILSVYNYDLVVPCADPAVIPIQQHKIEICKKARVYALSDDAFLSTINKYQTLLLAEQCKIPIPRWTLVHTPQEIGTVGDNFAFPVVLKPVSSFNLRCPTESRRVRIIRDKRDLAPVLEAMLHNDPVLVQDFFYGQSFGLELLAKDGQVLVAFQHERLHAPPAGGGSSYRRSVPLDARLLDAAKAFVSAVRYTGVMMVEFLVNPENGDWILVETNARFWGSLPLAVASGVDFPLYLYCMLVEGRTDFPKDYKIGVYCRNLRKDLSWLKKNFSADRIDPTLHVVPLRRILIEFKNVLTMSEHIDTFAVDDPRPFLTELSIIIKRAIGAMLRHTGLLRLVKAQRTRRTLNKLRGAARITFVCYGNICRSPFAEAYARLIMPVGVVFSSAGTFPEANRRSPAEACAAAKRVGIDLHAHRSRILSAELVEASDVIAVFDSHNLNGVLQKFPQAKSRILSLGDLLPGLDKEITDPYGQTAEQFDYCYRTIMNLLMRFRVKRMEL
jgi:protein-tyrosine-phosphatase